LVAKSLLKQFDVKQDDKKEEDLTDDEQALLDLAGNIEQEELTMAQEKDDADNKTEEEDDLEGWVDEVEALTLEEQENLEDSIRPVKKMLVKLQKLAYKIVHSTMILLPAWKECLENLELPIKIMPRDISTRWNSTYNMLCFAIQYRAAIEDMT
ncbi:hypothetical protein L208DRAFT_1077599, partial [Tricholoma matsutake]